MRVAACMMVLTGCVSQLGAIDRQDCIASGMVDHVYREPPDRLARWVGELFEEAGYDPGSLRYGASTDGSHGVRYVATRWWMRSGGDDSVRYLMELDPVDGGYRISIFHQSRGRQTYLRRDPITDRLEWKLLLRRAPERARELLACRDACPDNVFRPCAPACWGITP